MNLIEPMLATPSSGASNRRPIAIGDVCGKPEWLAQEKVDGIRALLYSQGGTVRLISRSGRNMTESFPEVGGLRRLPPMVLDGELVARDGLFSTVATREKQTRNIKGHADRHPCYFVAFDALVDRDEPLLRMRLDQRLEAMRVLVGQRKNIRPVRQSDDVRDLWTTVVAGGGEGIIAKRRGSLYLPGQRAPSWIKFKAVRRITAIAMGYQRGTGREFGAIHLAVLRGSKPISIGQVGTGWTDAEGRALQRRLDAGEMFPVEVEALNRTKDNVLRFPVYRGERADLPLTAATADQLTALPVY